MNKSRQILIFLFAILTIPINFIWLEQTDIFTCSYSNFDYCKMYKNINITILSQYSNNFIGEYSLKPLVIQCIIKDLNSNGKNITGTFLNGYYTNDQLLTCVTQKYVDNYIKNKNFTNNILLSLACSLIICTLILLSVILIEKCKMYLIYQDNENLSQSSESSIDTESSLKSESSIQSEI